MRRPSARRRRAPVGPAHHEHRHRPARRGQLPGGRFCLAAVRRAGRPGDADAHPRADHRDLGRRHALERHSLGLQGAAVDAALPRRRDGLGRSNGRLARRRLVRKLGARPDLRRHPRRRVRRRGHRLRRHRQHRGALVARRLRHPRAAGVRARPRRVAAPRARARRQGRARVRQGASSTRAAGPVPEGRPDDRRTAAGAGTRPRARSRARRRARGGTAHEPLARHPLCAARADEPDPDRRQCVRLLLPRGPADVRPGVLEGPVRDRPGARELSCS